MKCQAKLPKHIHKLKSFFDADVLKTSLAKSIPASQRYVHEYSNAYTKEYHNNKEYDKAIEFYLKAIDKGIRVESAIKDVVALYASLCIKLNTKPEF